MGRKHATGNVRTSDTPERSSRKPGAGEASTGDEGSRTLRRGLAILESIQQGATPGVRVAELCRVTGLGRASVYRLLATLIETGYVAKATRFHFVPGPRLTRTAEIPASKLEGRLRPILEQLSEKFGEASYAVVREGLLSHCIAKQAGALPMRFEEVQVGTRQPLGVGAAGLALLSALSKSRADAIVSANARALFPFGGMTPERMQLLVRATRERGWSVVGTHVSKKVLSVGVAIRNRQGAPIAAISVASTLERMPAERQKLIAAGIRAEIKASLPEGI